MGQLPEWGGAGSWVEQGAGKGYAEARGKASGRGNGMWRGGSRLGRVVSK